VLVAAALLPRPSHGDTVDRLLTWISSHFRVRVSALSTLTAFRGGAEPTGSLWIVPAAGGTPRTLVNDRGYRSPLFLQDGTIVALGPGNRIVHLAATDGRVLGEPCSAGGDPVDVLIVGEDNQRLGAVSLAGRILELELAGCRLRALKSLPRESKRANQIRLALQRTGRACGGLQVDTTLREADLERGTRREDVILRSADGAVTTLTQDAPLRLHHAPAFSPDCREVVFVAADSGL
jgi:hypothetical protein